MGFYLNFLQMSGCRLCSLCKTPRTENLATPRVAHHPARYELYIYHTSLDLSRRAEGYRGIVGRERSVFHSSPGLHQPRKQTSVTPSDTFIQVEITRLCLDETVLFGRGD